MVAAEKLALMLPLRKWPRVSERGEEKGREDASLTGRA